ncbi:hypothetical protein IV59_GL000644 [Paucilactobacillus hokkaidonensis]|nr:hypothetical protein IV59_GL000644 [Paucilactobacillus hokkaidonensis]
MAQINKQTGTYNPFLIADKLNIEVHWKNIYPRPFGETFYYGEQPIIMLSNSIKDSTERYFVLAHELGHVIEHQGLSAYYTSNSRFHNKTEDEANQFAIKLLTNLYVEENEKLPDSYLELHYMYGFPNWYE